VFGGNLISSVGTFSMSKSYNSALAADYEGAYTSGSGGSYAYESSRSYISSPSSSNFAPEITERKITKAASVSSEVEKGGFQSAAATLKSIAASTGTFILNENVNSYESGKKTYYAGSYQLKIPTNNYDSAISQLKQIGTLKQFNENAQDITGTFSNLEIEITTEKARLARYEAMYSEAKEIDDKINLNDRIYSEQRTIKYLEDRLANAGQRVDYSTVSVSISEKRSDFINIAIVKLSTLLETLVGSFNALIVMLVAVLPWVVAGAIIWAIIALIRRKSSAKKSK